MEKGSNGSVNAKMQNFGRPVIVRDKDWKTQQIRERKGTFHVWGYQRFGGKDTPPSMQTVAVVELDDGRITSKRPDDITFLDKATT
jgi:hypothetical protein